MTFHVASIAAVAVAVAAVAGDYHDTLREGGGQVSFQEELVVSTVTEVVELVVVVVVVAAAAAVANFSSRSQPEVAAFVMKKKPLRRLPT